MRSLDEQMQEIQRRESLLRREKQLRRTVFFSGLSCAACLTLLIVTALNLPSLSQSPSGVPVYYGTVLLGSSAADLVLIGVLSFALGVSLTLLCLTLYRKKKGREKP
jgi:pilus assembly protein TadC